jgi:hypothetical protein
MVGTFEVRDNVKENNFFDSTLCTCMDESLSISHFLDELVSINKMHMLGPHCATISHSKISSLLICATFKNYIFKRS